MLLTSLNVVCMVKKVKDLMLVLVGHHNVDCGMSVQAVHLTTLLLARQKRMTLISHLRMSIRIL